MHTELTDKQRLLLNTYERLNVEYQRLIDRKLEQFAAEEETERVLDENREKKKQRLLAELFDEADVETPANKRRSAGCFSNFFNRFY